MIRRFLISVLFPVLCGFAIQPGHAQVKNKRLIVIVVPSLHADDLARPELFTLRTILSRGAIGWMNTRTARVPGRRSPYDPEEAAYLTLGAGSRATAGDYARQISDSVFQRLKSENSRLDHPVMIGALGDMLRRAGVTISVRGEEDDTEPRRAAGWIAVDSDGNAAPNAAIKSDPLPAPLAPYGYRSRLMNLMPRPDGYSRPGSVHQDLAICVLGDLARADRYAPLCLPSIADRHRTNALENINAALQWIPWNLGQWPDDQKSMFILFAPCPADTAEPGDRLAPILMWGGDIRPGLLTSGSTHTPGLVTNTDFLPTVADFFGLKPPSGSVGQPMRIVPFPSHEPLLDRLQHLLRLVPDVRRVNIGPTPEQWAALHDDWVATSRKQSVFGGLPTVQFVLGLSGVAAVYWLRRYTDPVKQKVPACHPVTLSPCHLVILSSLSLLALPLALLLLPIISPAPIWQAATLLAGILLTAALIGVWGPQAALRAANGLLGALTVVSLLDLLTGTNLMRQAWMSYSVMEGARYYGLGNEYSGAILAATLLIAGAALRDKGLRYWPLVLLTGFAYAIVLGLPQGGADAGGLLGLSIGFGVAGLVWWRGTLRIRDLLLVVVITAVAMALVLGYDLARGTGSQSHIARAFGSGSSLWNIITRKAALNGWLLIHSYWSLGLLASGIGLGWLWRDTGSGLRSLWREDRGWRGAMAGLAAGVMSLLLLNDSGVVAAAECLLLVWAYAALIASGISSAHLSSQPREAPTAET